MMKIKNMILTMLLACMFCPSGQTMKKRHTDDDELSPTDSTIIPFLHLNADTDVNDYLSKLPDNELIQIITSIVNSFNLSTPPRIINAIQLLLRSKDENQRFNNLLIPKVIGYILRNTSADVNATIRNTKLNDYGFTALHLAARENNSTVIQILIDAGADIRATIKSSKIAEVSPDVKEPIVGFFEGMTALHVAVYNNCNNAIHTLINAGADVNVTINNPLGWNHGMTASDLAKQLRSPTYFSSPSQTLFH